MASELCVWYVKKTPKVEESSVTMPSGPNCHIHQFNEAGYAKTLRSITGQRKVYSDMEALKVEKAFSLHLTREMTPLVVVAPIPTATEYPHKKQRLDVNPVPAQEVLLEPVPEFSRIDVNGPYVLIPCVRRKLHILEYKVTPCCIAELK
ncbi:hypothetical protein AC1031_016480 [Aphanomyces cochlioides]|nr:hypothetical protein AC1031_016480 [Aphanomyces cochlioides]